MIQELRYISLIALIIFAYGSFNIYLSNTYEEPLYLLWTSFCYIAVIGLLLKKQWSKYLVHLLAFVTIAGWLYFTYYMYSNDWPYYEQSDIYRLFLIGFGLIVTSLLCSIYSHKYFNEQKP